jgi:LysM repeat protein
VSRADLTVARIAAPAVFLVAVIVLISLLFQSGVIGGDDQAKVAKPVPAAAKTKSASAKPTATVAATKIYVVKAGDTPSGIAEKYGISLARLQELNPDADFTTLVVGVKLQVPRQ